MASKFVSVVMALAVAAMVGGCEPADAVVHETPPEQGLGPSQPSSPGRSTPLARRAPPRVPVVPEPENAAPEILDFECSPAHGTVPFDVTCSWSTRDPDDDPLACTFDGQSPQPCATYTSASVRITSPGQRQFALRIDDGRGGTVQRSVVVEAIAPPPPTIDISIARIDWGQSVISENPRLVAGKTALLRVHVVSDDADTSGIAVRATGTRNGSTLGTLNLSGPGTLPTAIQESSLTKSFTAMVPASWIEPGLELQIEADADEAIAETNEQNNLRVLTPDVGAGTILYLTAVPVVHQGTTANVPSTYTSELVRIWPLQSVQGTVRTPYTWSGTLSGQGSSAWSTLLQQIAAVRAADGSSRYYYGFVDVSYGSGIAGIGYVGSPSAVGRDDSLDTMVHELGHNFGRQHAPCGTSGDPNFPYSGGRIGSWGYDAQTDKLISPSSAYDLMSYCDPSWVSDYNYRAVQSELEADPPTAFATTGASQPLLLVSGRVAADGTVTLSPLVRMRGPLEHKSADGDWTLRLQTATGATVEAPFNTERIDELELNESQFTLVIADPGTLRAVTLMHGAKTVLQRDAKPAPKSLFTPRMTEHEGRIELEWDAVNWPYASVAHLGEARTTLGLWLTGGRAELPAQGLPEGGRLEVSLSDGVNSVTSIIER